MTVATPAETQLAPRPTRRPDIPTSSRPGACGGHAIQMLQAWILVGLTSFTPKLLGSCHELLKTRVQRSRCSVAGSGWGQRPSGARRRLAPPPISVDACRVPDLDPRPALRRWDLAADDARVSPLGSGLINHTWLV